MYNCNRVFPSAHPNNSTPECGSSDLSFLGILGNENRVRRRLYTYLAKQEIGIDIGVNFLVNANVGEGSVPARSLSSLALWLFDVGGSSMLRTVLGRRAAQCVASVLCDASRRGGPAANRRQRGGRSESDAEQQCGDLARKLFLKERVISILALYITCIIRSNGECVKDA